MKLIAKSEFRNKSTKELISHLDELKQAIKGITFESRTKQGGNIHLTRNYKKQIARIQTFMSQMGKEL